jgi:hypothetical protein
MQNRFELLVKLFVVARGTGEHVLVKEYDKRSDIHSLNYETFVVELNGQFYDYKLYEQDPNNHLRYFKNLNHPYIMEWFFSTEIIEINY